MDIKQQIRELAQTAGVGLPPEPDQCWVDAKVRCPYGAPVGQFILRPESFCHRAKTRGDGCAVYDRHVVDPTVAEDEKQEAICAHFEAKSKDLSDVLQERAERLGDRTAARLALELAVAVLNESHLDIAVFLEDDLPKPQEQKPR